MRGRAQAWTAVAVAVAALAAAVAGCGDDEAARPGGPTTTATAPPVPPTEAPADFALHYDGWRWVGATDTHLVGMGGPAIDDDRYGEALDLETGEVTALPPPPFEDDRSVLVEGAAFGATSVTVMAFAYPTGFEAEVPWNTSGEPATDLVSFRLDPAAATWERLALPPAFAGADRFAFSDLSPAGDDDAAALLSPASAQRPAEEGTTPTILHLAAGARSWTEVAEGAPWAWSGGCATLTEWWQVHGGVEAKVARATSLADGSHREVALPDRLGDGLADELAVGCSEQVVAVAVTDGLQPGMVATSTDGETWVEDQDPFGGVAYQPQALDGGAVGPAVVAVHEGAGSEPGPPALAVSADGGLVEVAADARWDRVIWRGRTATLLVIGSGARPSEGEQVAIRSVEIA